MLWLFVGLLGGFAFVFLVRLMWFEQQRIESRKPLIRMAAVVLIASLAMLTLTGKLHWLSAMLAGLAPFLRRALGLLRYAPILKGIRSLWGGQGAARRSPPQAPGTSGILNLTQARQMFELGVDASRAEIITAHRRLMQKNHPDQGGSNYIAAQINEAKELLLKDLAD